METEERRQPEDEEDCMCTYLIRSLLDHHCRFRIPLSALCERRQRLSILLPEHFKSQARVPSFHHGPSAVFKDLAHISIIPFYVI
ncbi:hypothetical protein Q8A67_009071 [Cirrhinus molitorella]|uniref:Uncharacterized protein n=1 Tax=Cirrhinus molitorella TaxID=172907 RepID=A0AA88PYD8_9TELE|nr:hypothetical protein Q8A67_009071 [Cirrhinus molitorella]